MSPSLQALLKGVIDYAGLFPPAALPLDESFRNYRQYRQGPDAWMLGRFICPAARLAELTDLLSQETEGAPWSISAIARGGGYLKEFLANLKSDLQAIQRANQQLAGRAVVDALEVRLPPELLGSDQLEELSAVVHGADVLLVAERFRPLAWFFELSAGPNLIVPLLNLVGVLSRDAAKERGVKLRCGGPDARAIPLPLDVAQVIDACRSAEVPLKFTAGLHHPFRHRDDKLDAMQHGFINVLTASVLAWTFERGAVPAEMLAEVIADANSSHFACDDAALHWQDLSIATEEIEKVRKRVVSFGSCSFDEPRADLRQIGWLISEASQKR